MPAESDGLVVQFQLYLLYALKICLKNMVCVGIIFCLDREFSASFALLLLSEGSMLLCVMLWIVTVK